MEEIERARIYRAQHKDKYLKNVEKYDRKYLQLKQKLDRLNKEILTDREIEKGLQNLQETKQKEINEDEALLRKYKEKELTLKALNFDNGFEGNLESLQNIFDIFNIVS